jgi:hypothetical protein
MTDNNNLTDPIYIRNELFKIVDQQQTNLLSIMEKHAHNESIGREEQEAKDFIASLAKFMSVPVERQVIDTHLALESLARAVSQLVAQNNKQILAIIEQTGKRNVLR